MLKISYTTPLFIFFLITLAIVQPTNATVKEGDNDYIYCQAESRNSLYNQQEIIQHESYLNASDVQKKDMLEEHFRKMRISRYYKDLVSTGSYSLAIAPLAYAAYRYRTFLSSIPTYVGVGSAVMFNKWLSATGQRVGDSVVKLSNSVKQLYIHTTNQTALDTLELDYVRNKPDIAKNIQDIIERNIALARCADEYMPRGYDPIARIELALKLPRKAKQVIYDSNLMNNVLSGYNEKTLLHLKRYGVRHAAACSQENVRKIAAYFYGQPGVGKTRAAHLLAQTLGLPLQTIHLGEKSINDIVGTATTPGLLLQALTKVDQNQSASNMLILIDDADRTLTHTAEYELASFMLTLLDPESKKFYSPFLAADVDISQCGFIFTGNNHFTDAAMVSRLELIKFSGYDNEFKKRVAWAELIPSFIKLHENGPLRIDQSDITPHVKSSINKLIEEDTDQGFRSIKLKLMNFFEDMVLCKYFAEAESPSTCFQTKQSTFIG